MNIMLGLTLFFALLEHINALSGKLQMVGVDFFSEGRHYAFCALQQDGNDNMIALDNVARSHCLSDTMVDVEATITAANEVKDEQSHAHEPFHWEHAVITKIKSVNGVAISSALGIGSTYRSVKDQLDELVSIAGDQRRRLAATSGQSDLLLVRVKLVNDNTVDTYCNEACALSNGWGSLSARQSYAEASYGVLDIKASTGVVKTVSLSTSTTDYNGCNFDKLGDDAVAALTASGFSTNGFEVISFLMPQGIPSCNFGGVAYVGGTRSWVRYGDAATMVHELGHNYGTWHAGTDTNNDGVQDSEYGDYSCVMGAPSGVVTMHAVHRMILGWIPTVAVKTLDCPSGTVNCEGTFTIANLQESPSTVASSGRFSMVKTARVSRSGDYYISYRSGTGLDANLSSNYKGRVSLHYYTGGNTELVTTLGAGQVYSDVISVYGTPTEVLKITVVSIGSTGAQVKVEKFDYNPAGCVNVNIQMTDLYGDGWNGVNLYFTPDKSIYVTLPSGSSGTASLCMSPGTYSPFACDGTWHAEVGWSVAGYGVSGGASTSCTPISGSFTVVGSASSNPTRIPTRSPTPAPVTKAPTNKNPARSPTRPPTRGPSRSPTLLPTSMPTWAPTGLPSDSPTRVPTVTPTLPAPTTLPSETPECVVAEITMTDSWGDGWNGNVLHLSSHSIALESGSTGTTSVCLLPGMYIPTCCGGGWPGEVGWAIAINNVLVASGGATLLCQNFPSFEVIISTDTDAPSDAPSLAPTALATDAPSVSPTLYPTLPPTLTLTDAPSTIPTVASGACNAADMAKLLENQGQILSLLQTLAVGSAVQAPGGEDDSQETSSNGSSEGTGSPDRYTAVIYVLAAVGGIATLTVAAVLVLYKIGGLRQLGYDGSTTNADCGNKV